MFDYKKVITNKKVRLTILNILRFIPDKPMLKIEYFIRTGEKLNLKNPVLFTEKLQWLKLYNRKDIYSDMVDKIGKMVQFPKWQKNILQKKLVRSMLFPC